MNSNSSVSQLSIGEISPTFRDLCRNAARQRFTHVSSRHDVRIEENKLWDAMSYGSSMAIILVAGKDFKLFLKAHFHPKKSAMTFAKGRTKTQILDFYREYCNLIAGAIKHALLSQNLVCGISLPTIVSGYDELIFSDKFRADRYYDYFDVVLPEFKFTISIAADLNSEFVREAVKQCRHDVEDSEEIEFL